MSSDDCKVTDGGTLVVARNVPFDSEMQFFFFRVCCCSWIGSDMLARHSVVLAMIML